MRKDKNINKKRILAKLNREEKLYGCGAKMGEEVGGWEFEISNLRELIKVLQEYKSIHLNYLNDDEDLDLWIRVEN
jgi:hypothetical protein